MAFFNKHMQFEVHDDYMTPPSAWSAIQQFIPKEGQIWEPFYGDGKSGQVLRDLGFDVYHEREDFFENDHGTHVVTNPPFSESQRVLERLVKLDKPFIMILPASKITTQYFSNIFADAESRIQIIIPRRRLQFAKMVDGKVLDNYKSRCSFDCFYYCWKMNLPHDIIYLKD